MTLRKRLAILWAGVRQEWHIFTCPKCKQESYLCGHAPDLSGMLCQNCEAIEHDQWLTDFKARAAIGQKRSA